MDRLKKERTPVKASFTRTVNELISEFSKDDPECNIVTLKFDRLERCIVRLRQLDSRLRDDLMDTLNEEEYQGECLAMEEIEDRFTEMRIKVQDFNGLSKSSKYGTPTNDSPTSASPNSRKRYKLPKLKIKEFDGELISWLGFWSQFEKIHLDGGLDDSDKVQYLSQAMKEGTRAQQLVNSYPQTGENYLKIVDALKNRFAKDELLVEVYVREMLRLVINNLSSRDKLPLVTLYDKIETYLRALETLKLTTEKYAAMLYPMVESCLPEERLRAWQRCPNAFIDGSKLDPPRSRLSFLMEFMKMEVEGEEKIKLAQAGFGATVKKGNSKKYGPTEEELPTTAAALVNTEFKCIFCEKAHESKECFKAQKMTLADKKKQIQKSKCCFICLKPNHQSKQCKSRVSCVICSKKHCALLCPDLPVNSDKKMVSCDKEKGASASTEVQATNALTVISQCLLQTVLVKLVGEERSKVVRVLMDSGSQKSYILKRTAVDLGFKPTGSQSVIHKLFGGQSSKMTVHRKFNVKVESVDGDYECGLDVLDQEEICGKIPRLTKGPWLEELKMKGILINDSGNESPDIEFLIGSDYYGKLLTGRLIQLSNGMTAIETHLGWLVSGEIKRKSTFFNSCLVVNSMTMQQMSVPELWKLESIGITDPVEVKNIEENDVAVRDHFQRTVAKCSDGRYSVSLPWVDGQQNISSNRLVAEKRLVQATRKLENQKMFGVYQKVFDDWLAEGIIEEVSKDDVNSVHYLPHRPVFKANSTTTPVRPVFDASCKTGRSPSLNECLHKGPNLIAQIPSVLLKFREKRIGVISDIRKAFLMIDIEKKDRDYLRFLWWKTDSKEIKIYRHRRVVFGLNCSPFILGAVIHHHLSNVTGDEKEVAEKLLSSIYVDNCLCSVDNQEELEKFISSSTSIMTEAKMDLRMWQYNGDMDCGLQEKQLSCVLGLVWDRLNDTLEVEIEPIDHAEVITKRGILSIAQKVFDPLGFCSPVLLVPKLLLQEMWKQKVGWDEELEDETKKKFQKWYLELSCLGQVKVPRHIITCPDQSGSLSLHTFCDASQRAFATVIYLRIEHRRDVEVKFVMAKSRVAPVKLKSIPRLELLACGIGCRLASTVKKCLTVNLECHYWSDSTTALAWIRRNDSWGTFVGNRVKEILSLTSPSQWKYVPGKLNPADLPSRGCSAGELMDCQWWEGPIWLKRSPELWPITKTDPDEDLVSVERKKTVCVSHGAMITPISWEKLRSYDEVLRFTGFIRRITMKDRTCQLKDQLSVDELKEAQLRVLTSVQNEVYPGEQSRISGLRVARGEDGLIRVKTPILRMEESFEFRCPVLLPKSHPVTEMIVVKLHLENAHAGVQIVIVKMRENYWIPQSRRLIKSVLAKCLRCKKFKTKHFESEQTPLPLDRVKNAAVFQVVGVDLAGPLYLRDKKKVWIALFTCAVYRAVHLELVTSLSSHCFLLCLRRFIRRRGLPEIIYSDNGTNFTGSNHLLAHLDWSTITDETSTQQIKWRFNPPSAPWWGGWWERLVRSVKEILVRVLGKSTLDYEELLTILCDAESVVNNRPLTYLSENAEDLVPLTPQMFLREIVHDHVADLDDLDSKGFQRRYRYREKVRGEFRRRFQKEYLGQLVQRAKDLKSTRIPKVGEIVLIQTEKKRQTWPLAKIEEVIHGKDGVIRVVKLKTATGVLTRPIQRIFPLEVDTEVDMENQPTVADEESTLGNPEEIRTKCGRLVRQPVRFLE